MHLSWLDTLVFLGYIVSVICFALVVAARSKTKSSADYFLASKKLPWYAVGASLADGNPRFSASAGNLSSRAWGRRRQRISSPR